MSANYGTNRRINRFIALSASYLGLSAMRPDAGCGRRQARLNERAARTNRLAFAPDKSSQLQI